MRKVKTEEDFKTIWYESAAVICDFSATWCGPCKMLEPVLKKLENAYPGVVFVNVDIDENSELSDRYKVQAVPTVFFVKKGKVTKKVVGVESYESLSKHAKKLLAG
jgi:thioredoxin 1